MKKFSNDPSDKANHDGPEDTHFGAPTIRRNKCELLVTSAHEISSASDALRAFSRQIIAKSAHSRRMQKTLSLVAKFHAMFTTHILVGIIGALIGAIALRLLGF